MKLLTTFAAVPATTNLNIEPNTVMYASFSFQKAGPGKCIAFEYCPVTKRNFMITLH